MMSHNTPTRKCFGSPLSFIYYTIKGLLKRRSRVMKKVKLLYIIGLVMIASLPQLNPTILSMNGMERIVQDGGGLRKRGPGLGNWIWIDSSGQEVVMDVDKHMFMSRLRMHARDLRILDPQLSYPSAILGRTGAIVVNLEHIKAIITSKEVFLRDPSDNDVLHVVNGLRKCVRQVSVNLEHDGNTKHFEVEHQAEVKNGAQEDTPFEFQALEVALEAIYNCLSTSTMELEGAIYPALDILTSKVSIRNLERVRKLKIQLTRLTARVQKVRDELEHLLDHDNDMADLYLSRKPPIAPSSGSGPGVSNRLVGSFRMPEKNVELEKLLEAYFTQLDGTLNRLAMLREYSDSTEGFISIRLENHRNQLIQIELLLNNATLCLTLFGTIPSLFGINIPFSWNTSHGYLFKWTLLVIGAICVFLFFAINNYARSKCGLRS